MIGRIVCSKSGRDKGKFMVVVGSEDGYVYICDGKERPLSRPKKKNIKHIAVTNSSLSENQFVTDRSLRRALAQYRGGTQSFKEE